MNLRDKPELQERLAAEYALGTLRGPARMRFQRWLREDAATALAVARWEARLAPMAAAIVQVPPSARVWRAIKERIGGSRTSGSGFWESLAFWRNVGLFTGGTAATLFAVVVLTQAPQPVPGPAPFVLRVPSSEIPASYLAVLSDPKTQKPVLLVSAGRASDQLRVKTLDASIHVAERSLELWALPRGGAPKSLGLVSAEEKATLKLAAAADQSLDDVPALAVSLEPRGGSPTGAPTGPVIFKGPCVKML